MDWLLSRFLAEVISLDQEVWPLTFSNIEDFKGANCIENVYIQMASEGFSAEEMEYRFHCTRMLRAALRISRRDCRQ